MTGEVQARLPNVEKTTLAQASGIAMMPEVLGGSCSQNNGSRTQKKSGLTEDYRPRVF